jgi:hypothetical protein
MIIVILFYAFHRIVRQDPPTPLTPEFSWSPFEASLRFASSNPRLFRARFASDDLTPERCNAT